MKDKLYKLFLDVISPSKSIGRIKFIIFSTVLLLPLAYIGNKTLISIYDILILNLLLILLINVSLKRVFSLGFVRFWKTMIPIIVITFGGIFILNYIGSKYYLFITLARMQGDLEILLIVNATIVLPMLLLIPAKKADSAEQNLEDINISYKETLKFIFLNKEDSINRKTYLVATILVISVSTLLVYVLSIFNIVITGSAINLGSQVVLIISYLTLVYFVYNFTIKRVNAFNGHKIIAKVKAIVIPGLIVFSPNIIYFANSGHWNLVKYSLYYTAFLMLLNLLLFIFILFKKEDNTLTAEAHSRYKKIKHLALSLSLFVLYCSVFMYVLNILFFL